LDAAPADHVTSGLLLATPTAAMYVQDALEHHPDLVGTIGGELQTLTALYQLALAVERETDRAVLRCRDGGAGWADIAASLGNRREREVAEEFDERGRAGGIYRPARNEQYAALRRRQSADRQDPGR
jgi:3-dehydroquinate synthase class II